MMNFVVAIVGWTARVWNSFLNVYVIPLSDQEGDVISLFGIIFIIYVMYLWIDFLKYLSKGKSDR